MRHKVKKIKIKLGKDSNKMILKKMLKNFLKKGKITSTVKRIKLLKSLVEKVVSRAKVNNEKTRAYLFKYLNDKKLVNFLIDTVSKVFKDTSGGYVKLTKLYQRSSDGALCAQLIWTRPIFDESKEKIKEKVKKKN